MRVLFFYFVLFFLTAILTGCAAIAYYPGGVRAPIADPSASSPLKGTSLIGPFSNTSQKKGKACSTGILILAFGDSSLTAAKANGGITEISTVDYEVENFLGIYAKYCTIVAGN